MGTQPFVSAPRELASWLMVAVAVAACGNPFSPASHSSTHGHGSESSSVSPSAQPSSNSTPQPVTTPYGVLVSSQAATTYTVSLVGVDGKVVASSQASTPPIVSCANAAAAPVPLPVSASNSRVYYMDAQGGIFSLAPDGTTSRGPIVTLPAPTATRRSMFAVSPDDTMMAVVVNEYAASGADTKVLVYQLQQGGTQSQIYARSGARTLWPVGWHGNNNLVVAVVPSCVQGGGPFCCGIQELHVVDPANANRRFTLGDLASCPIVGPASPSGAICWDGTNSKVLSWTAATVRSYRVQGPEIQLLSPDGDQIALVDNNGTSIQGTNISMAGLLACAWLDNSHVLSGGDPQHQPRLGNTSTGSMVPVAAQGDCGGRLPGGL